MIWMLIKVQENIWIYRMEEISQAREIPGADSCHPVPRRPCSVSWSGRACEAERGQTGGRPQAGLLGMGFFSRGGCPEGVPSRPGRARAPGAFPALATPPSSLGPPRGQLPEISLNPYVGFGSSCFWLCSAAGDLRGGCVICTAVIRVIA